MKRPQRPARKQRCKDLARRVLIVLLRGRTLIVSKLCFWYACLCIPAYRLNDMVRCTVNLAVKRLGIGLKAHSEGGGARISDRFNRVWGGPRCYGSGGAVREERRIGGDVSDEGVKGGRGIGEGAGCMERLRAG